MPAGNGRRVSSFPLMSWPSPTSPAASPSPLASAPPGAYLGYDRYTPETGNGGASGRDDAPYNARQSAGTGPCEPAGARTRGIPGAGKVQYMVGSPNVGRFDRTG